MKNPKKHEPAASAKANGLDSAGALEGANNVHVAQGAEGDKIDWAADFSAAVKQIKAAYPRYTRAEVQDLASLVFGCTAGQLLFKYEPLGSGSDTECENRIRSIEFIAEAIAGNPVFRRQREEARCAAIALGSFKRTYDAMVADFLQTGGRA